MKRHVAFSHGPHLCVGAHFARLMARVAFEELLTRLPPLRVDRARASRLRSMFARGWLELPVEAG